MSGLADLAKEILEGNLAALQAIGPVVPAVARAAEIVADRLDAGGRLIYVGAGTSGRIATLDAAELPPTFGTDPGLVTVLLAGGTGAFAQAVEGAEDDEARGAADVTDAGIGLWDSVLGIAASGATPYVAGALARARELGAFTLALSCAKGSRLASIVDLALEVDTGAEFPRGSTRMKAGTAQKVVLNMLSTAVMSRRGLVWRGEMVAMRPTNAKLRDRARRIVRELLNAPADHAEGLLEDAGWELPVALVAGRWRLTSGRARTWIAAKSGNVSRALEEEPSRG